MALAVTVFCGSKFGNNPLFKEHAAALGAAFGKHEMSLVYGGGNNGLMGEIANAAIANGALVTGVMPALLAKQEILHTGVTTMHIAEDMHARKKLLYNLAEAAIILPGGAGTLDEFFEIITWNNLTIHDKKIILLNTAGFYNDLLAHMARMQQEGFLYFDYHSMFTVCDHPDTAIRDLLVWKDAGKN